MPCFPGNTPQLPSCDGSPMLICMQRGTDPAPVPIWVTSVCVDGVITDFEYFADPELAVPAADYTMANRVPCPENMRGSSCAVPNFSVLCAETIAEVQALLAAQTADLVAANNFSYVYVYNVDDTIQSVTRSSTAAGIPCEIQSYTYDGSGRLETVSEWIPCP